jgi:hypothetical protein
VWAIKGNNEKANYYAELANRIKKRFNETFWDDEKKRYVSTVDINGKVWDFGLTFLNLEALAYGLGDSKKAEYIFDWLDGNRIVEGDLSTGKDIYYYKIAPRANTIDIESTGSPYWWNDVGGAIPVTGPGGWDEHLENGGFIFYTEFYDIMARLKYKGIDNAFNRMKIVADEYAVDELRRDPLNSYGAPYRIGVVGEFPESGLVPVTFVYTIAGIDASKDGLTVAPNIPSDLTTATVTDMSYQGRDYEVNVWDDKVEIISLNKSTDPLKLNVGNLNPNTTYTIELTNMDRNSTLRKSVTTDSKGYLVVNEILKGATKITISR